jgi:EAL domain-containing protein (putative c-di-GMP-specific phosphodiesterase class I)
MGPKMADLLVAYLEQLGCDTFQGYLVSKPVPPQLFTEQFLTAEKVI